MRGFLKPPEKEMKGTGVGLPHASREGGLVKTNHHLWTIQGRSEPVVLVAEDDPNDFMLLQIAFERLKLRPQLFRAIDGDQALRFLKGEPPFSDRGLFPFPDLVLLDLKMPGCGGFEVLARLQAERIPGVRVVVLSGSFLEMDMQRARELGAEDYLVKAQDFQGMVELVRKLHQKWLAGCAMESAG